MAERQQEHELAAADEAAATRGSAEQARTVPAVDAFGHATASQLTALLEVLADPVSLLQPSPRLAGLARTCVKALFDHWTSSCGTEASPGRTVGAEPALQLHVDGFDSEQVWLQLDAALAPALRRIRGLTRRAADVDNLLPPDMEDALHDMLEPKPAHRHNSVSGELSSGSDVDGDDRSAEEGQEAGVFESDQANEGTRKRSAMPLPVEDAFLNIKDMEAFIDAAEAKQADSDGTTNTSDEEAGNPGSEEEDAELEALLDGAAELVSRRVGTRRRVQPGGSDSDRSMGDGGVPDVMYDEFFGKGARAARSSRSVSPAPLADEQQSDSSSSREAGSEASGQDTMTARVPPGTSTVQPGQQAGSAEPVSAHARRLTRMGQRVARLEEAALAEKDWFMRGEADASARPLNSALEVDMDFERTLRPPPQPTEEATASLESIIKRRVTDNQFDDVVRAAPPPPDSAAVQLELDDKKSGKGLGEVYEEAYVRAAAGNVALDRADDVRREARAVATALFAKLDALSHFHYAPKPAVEDLAVAAPVLALAMEEVAPQVASEADMRLPGEVFRASTRGGNARTEVELTREQRKANRAKRKRTARTVRLHKDPPSARTDRKSEAAEAAAAAAARQHKKRRVGSGADALKRGSQQPGKTQYSTSAVFAQLHLQQQAGIAKVDTGIVANPGRRQPMVASASKL